MTTTKTSGILLSAGNEVSVNALSGAFRLTFPQSTVIEEGSRIGLLECTMTYSWFNITTEFGNDTGLSYIWEGTTYPVNFPEGFYTVDAMNGYLHFVMDQNGHYLVDENGNRQYYLSFAVNQSYYRITLTATPVPAVLPVGWSNPTGVNLSGQSPQLVVSSSTSAGALLGYASGTYPAAPATSLTQLNGTLIPQISPANTIFMVCDWVNDGRFTTKPSVIASFIPPADTAFGAPFSIVPANLTMYEVVKGVKTGIQIRFVDQNYRPLHIRDPNQTVISLLLEEPVPPRK